MLHVNEYNLTVPHLEITFYLLHLGWQIRIDAQIGRETMAKKVCELGLVILVILARLLLPRGRITYSQLSSLFLGYAGMGADILGRLIFHLDSTCKDTVKFI